MSHVRTARKLAENEPRGWRPPKNWTPPTNAPAPSVPLSYHGPRAKGSLVPKVAIASILTVALAGVLARSSDYQTVQVASTIPADGACPGSFAGLALDAEHTCQCRVSLNSGSVWGSSVYTADSSICRAAQHAGATGATGGQVRIKSAPGCSSYSGTLRHGIQSSSWGAYPGSFYFIGHGDGQCGGPIGSSAGATLPGRNGSCPARFNQLSGDDASRGFECECAASQIDGIVWGSGIYTSDSAVCAAARHAGAITEAGGKLTVKAAPGCAAYSGATRNDVTTQSWGSYSGSFYFPGHGDGACR